MDGFEVEDRELPVPAVQVSEDTRERLIMVVSAMVVGKTPEQIAGFLDDGFPDIVRDNLARDGEREEMSAHIDVLLAVIQSPDD